MADYAKKKNDELASLCKDRGLTHTGKKADLVKRLEDYDASSSDPTAVITKPALEDEIDWDDEPSTSTASKTATTEPAADALAAGGIGAIPNPQNVPNQVVAEDPSQADDLTVDLPAAPVAPEAVEKDFSTGLADRTIDEEIEKRKARARKFGMPEDSDEIKALERARKFGTGDVPGLLNKALSMDGRKRGRGGEGGGDGDGDGNGVRKRSRGPQRGRPGMGGRRRGSGRRERTPQSGSGGGAGWMSSADKEAMERRKAKFGGAG